MTPDPFIIATAKFEWNSAPYGEKTKIIKKWADLIGCSYKSLYACMDTGRKRKKGDYRIQGIEDYARIVHQIKKKPPEHLGEISCDQAIAIAIQEGLVPDSLRNKVSTINRVARDTGLRKKKRRIQRYQAERPNQMHHVDASSSKCFYIKKELPDGDHILRIHAGKKGYKNKPVPIRKRPWIYGLVDDHSGFLVGRYIAALGESAVDNFDFMSYAWGKNDDKVFFGLPEQLKGDLGPMMRGPAANEFFDRLDIIIDPSTPENKESHGKIERPWRTIWQRFEIPFFGQTDWKKFEITLSELNKRFLNFQQEYNDMPHRYEKDISRRQAWQRINLAGGAVAMPEKALSTIAKRIERTVGTDGCFSVDNVIYEVKGLHDAKVYVYQGVFNDKWVVVDKSNGEKYEVENFTPNKIGEFTGHKETPHQKAVKAANDMELSPDLYSTPKDNKNVVQLPTRIKETPIIDDPLETNTYPSMEAAMQDFIVTSDLKLKKEDRKILEQLFIENGLSRRFVIDLAFNAQREVKGA